MVCSTQSIRTGSSESLVVPRSDITIEEKIGTGTFDVVHRGKWAGKEVAVKVVAITDDSIKKATLRELCIHR